MPSGAIMLSAIKSANDTILTGSSDKYVDFLDCCVAISMSMVWESDSC